MLFLVLAYGHQVGVIHQDVGSHQHGVGEQGVAGGESLGDFIFVGMAAFQQAHRTDGAEYPGQFIDFRHSGLAEKDAFFGIQAHGQKVRSEVAAVFPQRVCVVNGAHGVVVRQEVERFPAFLHADSRFHGSEVVADMQLAAGLKTCDDTHCARDFACSRPASQERGESKTGGAAGWIFFRHVPDS